MRRVLGLLIGLLLAVGLAGCQQLGELGIPGEVLAAARQAGGISDQATFVSAEQGQFAAVAGSDISPDVDGSVIVWKVVFHETIVPPCAPNARCIRTGPGLISVYLDAASLEPVMTMFRPDEG